MLLRESADFGGEGEGGGARIRGAEDRPADHEVAGAGGDRPRTP